jgi:hypothetical protein
VPTDPPDVARYRCGFRTALVPSAIVAQATGLTDIEWTVADPQAWGPRLFGRQENCLQIEIGGELLGRTEDGTYSLSIATPGTQEGAAAFFTWRSKIFEALDAKLVVTSVIEEIRATRDAQRDILELDGQGLTELPNDIRILHQSLKVLSLSNNQLSKLPDELVLLEHLTELDVSDNYLTELPAQIGRLTSLEMLSLAHNRLRELPPSIGQLTGLRDLRVNDNKLRKLPAEIWHLTTLRRLHIQQNRLTELPPEFACLEALWEWKVQPNRLPPSGRDGLKARDNPWTHPPEDVVRSGPKAIRAFLATHPSRLAEEGASSVYTVYVDDHQHRYGKQNYRRPLGSFPDYGTAIQLCKDWVDGFLSTLRETKADDLLEAYRRFGGDPWICGENPGYIFDAWRYAAQRCTEIALDGPQRPHGPTDGSR